MTGRYIEIKMYPLSFKEYLSYYNKQTLKKVDFVDESKDGFTYFQVAYTTREKDTLEIELKPLQNINDHYPKYILLNK